MAEEETETTSGQEKPTLETPPYDPDWDLPPLKMDLIEEGAVRMLRPITQKESERVLEEK
jgi:hypothetical protein